MKDTHTHTHIGHQFSLDHIHSLNILSWITHSLSRIALVNTALSSKLIHLPQVHITHTRKVSQTNASTHLHRAGLCVHFICAEVQQLDNNGCRGNQKEHSTWANGNVDHY